MRLNLVFIALMLVVSCSKTKPDVTQVKKTIIGLERMALDKWANGDPIGYSQNFAEDATYFDDIAAQNRIDGVESIQKYFKSLDGKIPKHKYELVNPKVQVYGDVAIITLIYNSFGENNEPGPPWKSTSVYRLKGDNWKVVHSNWSLIK